MGEQIETLARFVSDTSWDDIPETVRRHAKLVLLDTLGVILAGSEQPEVQQLRHRLIAPGGQGGTVLARGCPTTDPRTAALLNGIAGRSIELCEGHRYVSCQAAVQIVPAVLATGEWSSRNGRDVLTTLILAYDVAVRIGACLTPRDLAHQNGQAPLIGAVAAGAKLRGLNADETSRALRVGATLVLTPSYTNAVAGATALNVAGGMSGLAGALVPDLALAGFEAQDNAIEEAFSSLVGDGFQPEKMVEELGRRWEIARNYFRLRACCNPIYAALEALEEALAELRPSPDQIERIEVATYRFASLMCNSDPKNYFGAKYSLPHAAAAMVLRGSAGYGAFTEATVHDPAIAALRRLVQITEDPRFTAVTPHLKPARVTLVLKDGRQTTRTCESPRGDFQRPYQESEVREKFRQLAGQVLTAEGISTVERAVDQCEQLRSVRQLIGCISHYA
ncbi:MAG TPA: MmgE/PrpD family protein [Candidatus Tectomicrobia bacterium]|nr:MmgE/PrpD family protein [Candidatus Tectomicrobia bacterium]